MGRLRAAQGLLPQTPPELLRLGLEETCLSIKAMGMADPAGRVLATALDAPQPLAIKQAVERLTLLGALDAREALTPLGRLLSTIPVHPGRQGMAARILTHM
jgi:HrpA-like RNA helicase